MIKYTQDFEQLWKIYPSRAGGNPKRAAYTAFKARLREGVLYSDLQAAVLRYYNFCKQTGKIDTEYTQRASTFFGAQGEAWLESWAVPVKEVKESVEQKGIRLGIPARPGESFEEWDRRIAQAR